MKEKKEILICVDLSKFSQEILEIDSTLCPTYGG